MNETGMKKENGLLQQIAKFGLVGVLCFVIDYAVYRLMNLVFEKTGVADAFPSYIYLSLAAAFIVSVVVNYLLSMRYVFTRRQDMSRKREFTVFVILSVIGLLINEACMYIGMDVIYAHLSFVRNLMSFDFAKDIFFKFGATGVVMVYNFISRKLFLEGAGKDADAGAQ